MAKISNTESKLYAEIDRLKAELAKLTECGNLYAQNSDDTWACYEQKGKELQAALDAEREKSLGLEKEITRLVRDKTTAFRIEVDAYCRKANKADEAYSKEAEKVRGLMDSLGKISRQEYAMCEQSNGMRPWAIADAALDAAKEGAD